MSQIPDHLPAHVSVVNEFPEDLYLAMRDFNTVCCRRRWPASCSSTAAATGP
jgi:hypothetical protein